MKKVLSFVLVLSMILGSFGMAFAAAPSDVVGKDYEDAVNVLMELGVVDGYKDGTYRPENVVTRAEMATLIIKALGLNDYAVGKSSFSDMAGHWADAYVAYAASLGFISGYGDGTFRPNQPVTYDQAITMVVQALGYKAEYMVGGYPGAFVAQAKTLGMLDDIKSGAAGANRGDVATLLYNTLPVNFVRYDKDGFIQDIEDRDGKADNMMNRLGAEAYTPNGGRAGDAFVVKTADADSAAINIKSYLGAYVTAYANNDGDIIAIKEVKSTFLTGKLDGGKFEANDVDYSYTMGYGNNNTQPAVKIVNGKTNGTIDTLGTDTVTIAAKVSGKTIKEIYSVATWTPDVAQKVDATDLEDVEDDCKLLTKNFATDDNDEIDYDSFELIGVAKLSDIKEDNIVYVYVSSDDNEITRVAVGTAVVKGEVTKKNTSDKEFTINGKTYGFADNAESAITDIKVGDSYEVYLDFDGDVFVVDAVEEKADDYAIVLDRADGSKGLNGSDAKIKLLLADGSSKTFVIDEDAIDSDSTKTDIEGVTAIDKIEDNYATGSAVKYAVKEGLVTKLEKVTMPAATKKDISKKGSFGGYMLASNVVILTQEDLAESATKFSDDADDFGTATRQSVLGQEDVVASYLLDDDGEIVFMVMDGQGTSGDIVYGFVTKIDELADDEYELTVMVAGKEVTYKSESNSFESDKLYAFDFDADGYAKEAKAEDNDSAPLTVEAEGTITRVTDKVYVVDRTTYALTLDADVVVYEYKDGKVETASKADLKGKNTRAVKFYDIDEDGVADIVVFYKL